jgi:sugar transferase EpsL
MKRLFDIVIVLAFAVLWVPLLFLVILLCKIFIGSPVLFRQKRPGLHGKEFVLCKFRTLINVHKENERPLSDEERLTRFGKVLRKISLDELPELWSVLKGDMSLVGPRPLLMRYLDHYTPEQARRHEVKPGITGWAQINGRNALPFAERFKFDVWYVDNQSLWLDIKILFLTAWKSLICEGNKQTGQVQEVFGNIEDS